MSELNKEILRWVLLIGAAPIWWPFLRTLWRDFNDALRTEGGLFGRKPGPRELERLEAERAERTETLISEPYVRPGERRTTRMRTPRAGAQRARSNGARPSGPPRSGRPSGFR